MLGILLTDKPKGLTSHDVIDRLRRTFGTKRVGHAGTLDPLATGLLVVAVGPATRFLQYLPLEPKVYVAEVAFGRRTTSYDAEGETVSETPVPSDLETRLEEAIPRFLGLIEQIPPMFSAVKVAGKPLYRYARKGEDVERKPRTVHVAAIEVLALTQNSATLRIECSGGTYVRTLADDLGTAIGCGAYLSDLRRTAVGSFDLSRAAALDAAGAEHLIPLAEALRPMPMVAMTDADVRSIREGRAIELGADQAHPKVALLDPEGRVFSVAAVDGNLARPECVIPSEATH